MQRPITSAMILAAAIGGPYVVFETPVFQGVTQSIGLTGSDVESPSSEDARPAGHLTGYSGQVGLMSPQEISDALGFEPGRLPPIEGSQNLNFIPIRALSEVVRFDVSPSWVPQRFPRVSTIVGDLQLDGLRVPLVTGTSSNDLAGTLTYYFDRYKRVQRISIHAITGDPSRFVAEMQHAYRLQQQPSLGGGLYLKKWNGRPTSLVYTAPAPVISADKPNARYQFFAEINQAGLEYGMSPEAQKLLVAGQQASRW